MYGALASGTGRIKRISPREVKESNKMGVAAGDLNARTHIFTHTQTRTQYCLHVSTNSATHMQN